MFAFIMDVTLPLNKIFERYVNVFSKSIFKWFETTLRGLNLIYIYIACCMFPMNTKTCITCPCSYLVALL